MTALAAVEERWGARVTPTGQQLVFEPALVGLAAIAFVDRKLNLDESQDVALMLPLDPDARTVDWRDAQPVGLSERDLRDRARPRTRCLPAGHSVEFFRGAAA